MHKIFKANIYSSLIIKLVFVLGLYFISRFIFFSFNTDLFPGIDAKNWYNIIKGGFSFDIAALLYINALYIFSQLIPFRFRYHAAYQKYTGLVFIIFNAVAFLANCIDIIYFRFTLRRSTLLVLKEFKHEEDAGSFLFQFLVDYWYIFLIFFIILFSLIWIQKIIQLKSPSTLPGKYYYPLATVIMLASVVFIVGGIRGDFKHSTRPITMSNAGEYVSTPNQVPLVLNTPFCLIRTYGQKFYKPISWLPADEINSIYNPEQELYSDQPFKADNVVIIILESFGKDAIGFYNKDLNNGTYKGYTPFLDSLIGESRVCLNSFANGRKSIEAIPSLLAGIPTGVTPFVLTPYAQDSIKSLPAILKDKGYNLSFFHGAADNSMGFKAMLSLMGLHNYYGKTEYNNDKDFDGLWGIWDEPFFQYFAHQLDTMKEPFFSTIFSASSHHPFKVPEKYTNKFPKGKLPIYECIGYTDMALRKYFEYASKQPWFKNTLFVISADHASVSQFGEYQNSLGDMSIPIIFYHYGDSSLKKMDNSLVQQTDVMPSILGYLNYTGKIVSFGKNIFDNTHQNFAANYMNGYRWMDSSYVLEMSDSTVTGLFNYKTDRFLKTNLMSSNILKKKELALKLKAYQQQYVNRLLGNHLMPGQN